MLLIFGEKMKVIVNVKKKFLLSVLNVCFEFKFFEC